MIRTTHFHRFKRFRNEAINLLPTGLTLLAGGNNSGKSTVLHGLAVWEFCRTVVLMEKGRSQLQAGAQKVGLGLGDDEFSPIAVPSLRHLWNNLKPQKTVEPDGYTLKVRCDWTNDRDSERHLEFGLSLANDRLFVKVTGTNLDDIDRVPRVAYLPPFAGMTDREGRIPMAVRRRRIGEGLAGAVLRNILLDMYLANIERRRELRGDRPKITDAALRTLRETDPWERLQAALRKTFSAELDIEPFNEAYHSYIRVRVIRGEVQGYKIRREPGYNNRDVMVEGSGFLQWLSVYALAVDPNIDVLCLDEPDAHLHPSLQTNLIETLDDIATSAPKQVLVATHSVEVLRGANVDRILEIRDGDIRYLRSDDQKVALFSGLGTQYAPKIDRLKRTGCLLFLEGGTDANVLEIAASKLGRQWPSEWVIWPTPSGHKERKQIFLALQSEIPGLVAVSLRDRDDEPTTSVVADLADRTHANGPAGFHPLKWRRRNIEGHFVWPPSIAAVANKTEQEVIAALAQQGLAIDPAIFPPSARSSHRSIARRQS